jgi:hypothetical protein
VFILIHSIIIGSLCVSKLSIVMLLTTLSNQSRREAVGGGDTLYLKVTRDGGGRVHQFVPGPVVGSRRPCVSLVMREGWAGGGAEVIAR